MANNICIKNNVFRDCAGDGVNIFEQADNCSVVNNSFRKIAGKCILFGNQLSATSKVLNNVIDGDGVTAVGIEVVSTNLGVIDYNNVYDCTANFAGNASQGVNDISQDPLFVSDSDLQLQEGSPSLDKGAGNSTHLEVPINDFLGTSRPINQPEIEDADDGTDQGAYEMASFSPPIPIEPEDAPVGLSGTRYYRNKALTIGQAVMDFFSGSLRVISGIHSHIHEGKCFQVYKKVTGLVDEAKTYIEIKTPNILPPHFKGIKIRVSDGPVILRIIEDPVLTTGSTRIIPINRNRSLIGGSIIASESIVKSNPTGVSGGTELDSWEFGVTGQGFYSPDSAVGDDDEWIFGGGGRTYLFELQNISGGPITAAIKMLWYEN